MKHLFPMAFLFLTAGQASAIQVYAEHLQNEACGTSTGAIDISVTGGLPPYTFVWNNGATTEDIGGLAAGFYSVTVTDANSDQATGQWTIYDTQLWSPGSAQDGHASCTGQMGGEVQVIEAGLNGTAPYDYSPAPDGFDPQGDPYFIFPVAPAGTEVSINVTDANGCSGTVWETVTGPQPIGGVNMVVSDVQGSCSGGTGGSATISNIYDGIFFNGPSYQLRDAAEAGFGNGQNAPNTIVFSGLPPGDYHFVRDWDPSGYIMAYPCDGNPYDRIDFTIPDLGPDCGSVSGTVFIDNDQDCAQDAGEVGVPYQVLEILPGPSYTITGSDGHYAFDLQDGAYTLGQTDPALVQLCPGNAPVPFEIASDQSMIDLADSSTVALDLAVELASGPMRPGFAGTFYGHVRNLSPQVSGPATITLAIDNALTYVAALPVPTSVTGNTLTWELPALTALAILDLNVAVQVPVGTPLGTPLASTLDAQNTLAEGVLTNNNDTWNAVVTGSYDPNDKTARTSTGTSDTQFLIGEDEWIAYTIRFQNTGTDTAFTVVVRDTIAPELDMASFAQGTASHPFNVAFKPDRVVEWTFADILLPDSGTNEVASHGLVTFRIRPQMPLLPGTVIANTANIYFDFNEPVITEPSVLMAEFSTSVDGTGLSGSNLAPNPTDGVLYVRLPEGADRAFSVWSSDGRRVEVTGRATMQGLQLDAGRLAPGVYMLRTASVTARFVKQ